MKFGLSPEQFRYILKTVVDPLRSENAKVWCYGSRARGDHKPFSDLDLMIESDHDLSSELAEIREVLINGNFPYKVDLVQLSEFADSYRPGFERDKVLFQ